MLTEAAAWLTVNVRPAIVAVPTLAAPEFWATVSDAVPFPTPEPEFIVIQEAPLVLLQGQPDPAVTATLSVTSALETDCEIGLML